MNYGVDFSSGLPKFPLERLRKNPEEQAKSPKNRFSGAKARVDFKATYGTIKVVP